MKYWTSDLHLSHFNIIKYTNRPFSNIEEMNSVLGNNWDSIIKPNDQVYILGDISFQEDIAINWLNKRPGQKFIVWGNHDPKTAVRRNKILQRVNAIGADLLETTLDHTSVVMCHYPMLRWNRGHHGSWMLHGHTHGGCIYPSNDERIIDVGVDMSWAGHNKYFPVSENELVLKFKNCRSIIHHKRD
jgi:calcineurin-like phosphoesterase family protein